MFGESAYVIQPSSYDFGPVFRHVLQPVVNIFYFALFSSLAILSAMFVYALLKYRLNLFKLNPQILKRKRIKFQLFDFLRWFYIDMHARKEQGREFDQYGFTMYSGRQGAGKTTSMVEYLDRMRKLFPKAKIVTNFKYKYATHQMEDWRDFFKIRNGTDGVIFAIDEIHSEFSTASSKDFPEALLSEISQQRKQRIKIVATSQVYARVAKPIREQCFTVVQCETFLNRWTFTREYDAYEYELNANSVQVKKKVYALSRRSFVQSDELRKSFDTYEKIERLKGKEFLTRAENLYAMVGTSS